MKANRLESYSITAVTVILGILATAPAKSQPITPSNDGTGTTVNQNGNQFNIQGGTHNGTNLFHSFDQFNVNSGQTANFISTPDTRNILGRITGGNASIINGLIQVIGGNSNLFLMNPAGIMFGPNASLNIPASFSVTTATGIGFNSNNFWFQAMGTNDYANLVGNPSGYRFNISNPGAIVNEGNLSLNPGENLTLLGGTVINTGELSTAGGNVTIVAVEGGSTLRISQPGHLLSLEVDSTIANGENLSGMTPFSLPELLTGGGITQATSMTVNADGDVVLVDSNTLVADTPGTAITAGNINVSTNSTPSLSTGGQGGSNVGGNINVLGDRVAIIDANINADGLNGGGQILIGGDFQGNGIVPNSQQTFVNNNSFISADSTTNGDGGQVIIWSDGITNFAGNISAKAGEFSGDGGFVEVSGKQHLIFDGVVDVSAVFGKAGTILLDPENVTVGESGNTGNSDTVEDNSEVEATENTETDTTENSDNSETETEENNSAPESTENTETETGENNSAPESTENTETETVENNSEVSATENTDNLDTTENTDSPTTEIAENSETTEIETPIDPFAQDDNADVTISAENIGELSGDIILLADNDITINEKIETTESVELKAGRSININADIDTSVGNGNIDLFGNNNEMNFANRGEGKASINQLDGTTLNAGSGRINIELGNLGEVGDINLANLTTTGQVLVDANGGNIARVSEDSLINAGSVLFQTSGSGGIGLTDAPLQLNVENLEAVSGSGGAFFNVLENVNIGGVSEDVNGIVTAGGDIKINSQGNVTLTESISTVETIDNNSEVTSTENVENTETEITSTENTEIADNNQTEIVENNSEVASTENTEITDNNDVGGAINIEATGDIVATGSGIKGGGESVSLSATNITINDEFEETSGDADVKLEATNDITVEDIEDDVLEFLPGGGEIEFRADVDGDGIGVVEMLDNEADVGSDPNTFENGADTIKTNGRNLTIAGASISLGNVDTSGLPVFSGGELLGAIDVDEGGPIPPGVEDKSGLIPEEDVDFSDIEFDENFNYIIDGESYYYAEIEGEFYYVPIAQLNDTATFTFTVDGNLANVENLDVRFSAAHTWNSDLEVYLESPKGKAVTLFATVGGSGDNFQDTVLDDDASTNIGSGIAPFDGRYIPQGSLADFNGENPNGIWTLRVTDIFPEFSSGTLYRAGDAAPWGSATGTQLLLRNPTTLVSSGGNGGAINLEATQGDISVGNIRSLSDTGNGGRVDLKANNSIITGLINSNSSQGIGGDINLNAVSGNIDTFSLDTSSFDRDGGNVEIEAVGDITTAEIITNSGEFIVSQFGVQQSNGGSGNAGNISIESTTGSIDTTTGSVFARSVSGEGGNITLDAGVNIEMASVDSSSGTIDGNSGNGGNITLDAGGDIEMVSVDSSSGTIDGNSENGGNITLDAGGDIEMVSVDSSSNTTAGNSGNGGNITLDAGGNIEMVSVNSSSNTTDGNSGNGGNITLDAGGNIALDLGGNIEMTLIDTFAEVNSSSDARIGGSYIIGVSLPDSEGNSGNGGDITLTAGDNITTEGIVSRSSANYGNSGNGGNITLDAGGNITTAGIISHSLALNSNSGNGGNITLTAGDDITTTSSSLGMSNPGSILIESGEGFFSFSGGGTFALLEGVSSYSEAKTEGNSGNGGNITLNAAGNITTAGITSRSAAFESNSGNGGNITLNAQGNINTEFFQSFSYSINNSGNGGAISLIADTIKFNPPEFSNTQQLQIRTFSVGKNDSGSSGDVNITTNDLSNAEILTLSSHEKSGQVTIENQSQGNLQFSDLSIITSKQVTLMLDNFTIITIDVGDTQGQSGDVNIFSSGNLSLNNVNIESDTKGDQPAGDVNINSQKTITLDNTDILSITSAEGNAGNITLETPQDIQLTNNSQLRANTEGTGNAGRINIEANKLNLEQGTSLITETYAAGAPGDITIEANTVDIGQDAQISATVVLGAPTTGDGGNITINTNELNITGKLGIFAETEASANAGTLILSPYKDNPDLNINFSNDGFISASTSSTGNGGNINISAPESIDISGEGFISVETSDKGNAGTINIETQNLTLSDGVAISASTTDKGNAGAINIDTEEFTLETGTSLTTETNDRGKAGDIEINTRQLTIGEDAQISATATEGATNTEAGGNITINATDLLISGQLGIFAETAGETPAGTLTLKPYRRNPDLNITFTENGFISARTTSSGDGGNINIFAPENINISGEGRITVETEGRGNAGIINIETENLTIAENTTISAATSDRGDGGSININPSESFQLEGQIITETTGAGDGGKITINTGELSAENSTISARSTDAGNAGAIEITAQENITTGIIQSSASESKETADGGDISITSEQGEINATQPIQSFSEKGNAGDVSLTAKTDVTTNTISSHGEQQGGEITVITETGNIDTSDGFLANYSGEGTGGNVTLEASAGNITTDDIYSFADADGGQILLKAGGNINIKENSNIISASEPATTSDTENPGKGGDIILEADGNINTTTARIYSGADEGDTGAIDIVADDAIEVGQIDLASGFVREEIPVFNNFTLIPIPQGEATQGIAGNISITSNNGTIDTTAGVINSRSPDGTGDITLNARENITVGKLEASALNETKPTTGGKVEIISENGEVNSTQAIETFSEQGTAGNVNIQAESSVDLENILSQGRMRGGDITIDSRSANSIDVQGQLNTFSTEGIGGDVTLTSLGNISISGIRSEGMQQGGDITLESEIGQISSTGDITSFSEEGRGGNIEIDAPESVTLENILSFGATDSGDLRIKSQTATVNTGNVTTQAPDGPSGEVIINGSQITTGNLSSLGTVSSGIIQVEATDGSITTLDLESIASEGEADGIDLDATGDITTEDQAVISGDGDANIDIDAGGDVSVGNQEAIANQGDANIDIQAGGDINVENQTAQANQGDANIDIQAGGDIFVEEQIAISEGGNTTINNTPEPIAIAPDNTNTPEPIAIAPDNTNTPEPIAIAPDNTNTPEQIAIAPQEIETITNVDTGDTIIPENTTNNQILPVETNPTQAENLDNSTEIPAMTSTDITATQTDNNQPQSILQQISGNSNFFTLTAPTNNNQTINAGTAQEQTETSISTTTDTQQILKTINPVNTKSLITATASDQVVTMLERNSLQEYSDYLGADLEEKLISTQSVRDILSDMANQTGKESAIVYINVYPEQLQIILYTKEGQPIIKTIPEVNREQIMKVALELRIRVTSPSHQYNDSYLLPAQQLYNWLIAPIASELEAANIDTLLFSMDEGLRTLAVAALHDGEQFLIEKYSLSLIPSVSLMDTNYRPLQDTRVLAMGASEFIAHNSLPGVPVELEIISQKLWQGSMFLNEDFTLNNLITQRESYPYPIIHLATHADFRPGKISNSYIQLWGTEQIKLDQIRELGWNESSVELLVLSACRTAFGDKDAELGFAGLAIAAGVKSALASIWYVNDRATLALMTEFYSHLNQTKIKAEAVRQAQLAMLRGDVVIRENQIRRVGDRGSVVLASVLGEMRNRKLSHPYHWAGFTMVGSPW